MYVMSNTSKTWATPPKDCPSRPPKFALKYAAFWASGTVPFQSIQQTGDFFNFSKNLRKSDKSKENYWRCFPKMAMTVTCLIDRNGTVCNLGQGFWVLG